MLSIRLFAAAAMTLAALVAAPNAPAEEAITIRLGALAPRGTAWHRKLLEMGEQWRVAQGAGAQFIVYGGGSQGGEADMVRRMRIGQLNAAMLTVIGLSEIDASVAALQKMPLVFRSWDELDYVREKLRPALEKRFLDKGFVVLCWGDAGWVRFFSKEPALRPADYRRMKMFAWAGDAPQVDIMKALGYQPVVLEVSDILPGLADRHGQRGAEHAVLGADAPVLRSRAVHARARLGADGRARSSSRARRGTRCRPAGREALRKAGEVAGVRTACP